MTQEDKYKMMNKYKYGVDYGSKIMNDSEAKKIKERDDSRRDNKTD